MPFALILHEKQTIKKKTSSLCLEPAVLILLGNVDGMNICPMYYKLKID